MGWTDAFKDALANIGDGTSLTEFNTRGYTPAFRVTIGTNAVSGYHQGADEKANRPKILELSTHPSSCSIKPDAGWRFIGTHGTGTPFMYGVGLTQQISIGAQSVNPRSFVYTGMTFNLGCTQWAASAATQVPIGTLALLQIHLGVGSAGWETIAVGTYKGMKWNGETYTLSFGDGLDAARHHSTMANVYADEDKDSDRAKWFAGCGSTAKVVTTLTNFAGGQDLELDAGFYTSFDEGERWNHTMKMDSAYGGMDYSYAGAGIDQWVAIKNASGKDTYCYYTGKGLHSTGGANRLKLTGIKTSSGYSYPLPGYSGLEGEDVSGTIGADSVVTNVCVVAGTPVTELVNTVYLQGYHEEMVPGIFGRPELWDRWRPNDVVNMDDIDQAHEYFNHQYTAATGRSSKTDLPFRFVAIKAESNGLNTINKLTGKWGVFPRFKENGYGVGVASNEAARDMDSLRDIPTIPASDLEGAEFSIRNEQVAGAYRGGNYISRDKDNGAEGAEVSVGRWLMKDILGPDKTRATPVFPPLTILTSDCAAGRSPQFKLYTEGLQVQFYGRPHMTLTMRLRGFKWAHLAPGDYVYTREMDGSSWGPKIARGRGTGESVYFTNVLDNELTTDPYSTWLVTSSHVDWINCLVTLRLTTSITTIADGWSERWFSMVDSEMSETMGMPVIHPHFG